MLGGGSSALDSVQDRVRRLRPEEGFGAFSVVNLNVAAQLLAQSLDTRESTAIESAALQLTEPPFYGVQPRGTGRCEMDLDSGVGVEKLPDFLGFVGATVVHDEMQVQVTFYVALDLTEEGQKLPAAMPLRHSAHDLAAGDVEGGIKTGRSMALVVVRPTLDLPWPKL